MSTAAPQTTIHPIALDKIHPSPLNPRKHFDEAKLEELANSIRSKGVRSPLEVRPGKKTGTFELIAGERRWRASQRAGLDVLPCIVTECTDAELVELALTENGQRDDLTPMDEARSYRAAMKADPKHYTVAVVAAAVGKSESYVYRRLKLLELADELQVALDEGRLSIAHAEKLMRLPVKLQKEAASLDGRGVVWSRSPLLRYNEKWVPAAEDLMPLAGLEKFIRERSHFDPAHKDTRHLQPELIEQLQPIVDEAVGEIATTGVQVGEDLMLEQELASLIELSVDPMVRMRMRAGKTDKVPLSPSKWKQVKDLKACAWARRGAVTHGGEAKLLTVCIGKGKCTKHWPAPAKKKATRTASRSTTAATTPKGPTPAELKAKRISAAWDLVKTSAKAAMVAHLKGVKLTAALLKCMVGSSHWGFEVSSPKDVEDDFGVTLTDATAAQVLVLGAIGDREFDTLADFQTIAKRYGLNPVKVLGAHAAQVKALEAEEKAAATPAKVKKAKSGKAVR